MFVFVIKNIRLKKSLTIYQLSKMTNIARTYLVELENNKKINPSLKTMYKIANALEVKVDDLFYSELDIDNLKEEMYRRIDEYGIDSKEALEVSQVIDLLINIKMKRDQLLSQLISTYMPPVLSFGRSALLHLITEPLGRDSYLSILKQQ